MPEKNDADPRGPKDQGAPVGAPDLVLGATSLIGAFLLPLLADPGRPVIAVSRRPQAPEPGVRWIEGDLGSAALEALDAVSVVFCLAPIWVLPPLAGRLAALGARRIVAFSSTSRFTKAASPSAPEREVAHRLAAAEDEAFAAFDALRIPLTVLRPTLVYAEGRDGNVSRLAALISKLGLLPLLGSGSGLRQPVHAEDLAGLALAAVDRARTFGRSYDVPGGETLSYRVMAERIFAALGRRPRILCLPPLLWSAAFLLARPLLPGATLGMGARMRADLVFDGAPARRDLDWRPREFHPVFSQGGGRPAPLRGR